MTTTSIQTQIDVLAKKFGDCDYCDDRYLCVADPLIDPCPKCKSPAKFPSLRAYVHDDEQKCSPSCSGAGRS